jgi:site-specific recombinase XerC
VLANLQGIYWLIGGLLYGSGLRLTEVLRLRIKDLELETAASSFATAKVERIA